MFPRLLAVAVVAAATLASASAQATVLAFTGSAMNIGNPPVADPGCPVLKAAFGPANTAGTSNFGDFTFTQAHCTTGGAGAYSGGVFSYLFAAGDSLAGTYSGVATFNSPGLLNNTITYVVTDGTGRFLGSSGSITGVGTVDFRMGAPRQALTLNGELNLPAVPEPATWSLMILGFGAAGGMLRRRRVGLA